MIEKKAIFEIVIISCSLCSEIASHHLESLTFTMESTSPGMPGRPRSLSLLRPLLCIPYAVQLQHCGQAGFVSLHEAFHTRVHLRASSTLQHLLSAPFRCLLCRGSRRPEETQGCVSVLWNSATKSYKTEHQRALQDQNSTVNRTGRQSTESSPAFPPDH